MAAQLQAAINYALCQIFGKPLTNVLGATNEPALSIGNRVKETILAPPFAWPWNRASLDFRLTPGSYDYSVSAATFGWIEKAAIFQGAIITNTALTANVATYTAVNNLAANQKVTVSGTTNGGGVFNVANAVVLASGLSASQFQLAVNAANVGTAADTGRAMIPGTLFEPEVRSALVSDVNLARPSFVAVQADDNAGNITFRMQSSPDAAYQCQIIFQKAPVMFAALTDTWAPIPDNRMLHVYLAGFTAYAFARARDERFLPELQTFGRNLVGASVGLSETQKNIFMQDFIARNTGAQGDATLGAAKTRQG